MHHQEFKVASSPFYLVSLATIESAKEILDLQKLAYQSEAEIYQNWSIPPLCQTIEGIEKEFSDHIFYKATVLENIIGSVRAMVIAGQDGAYGAAEKAVEVKKPLMVLARITVGRPLVS